MAARDVTALMAARDLVGKSPSPTQAGRSSFLRISPGRPWGLAFVAGLHAYHGPAPHAAGELLGDSGPGGLTPWGHRQGRMTGDAQVASESGN